MQTSNYVNHMMDNSSSSQHKSKKKLRFFSKSKKKDSGGSSYPYADQQQCYCEDCMRTVHQSNYTLASQQMTQYYYPREDQVLKAQPLSTADQRSRDQSSYASDQFNRIYPPPQQFPCECTDCCKKRGTNLTTELLPLDTQIPLQMMSDSALLCNIL